MAAAVGLQALLARQFIADGAVTAYRLVKLSTNSTDDQPRVTALGATTDQAIGVCMESATDGLPVRVLLLGIGTVEAHAAITRGTLLTAGATTGRVSTQAAGSGVNQPLIGIALESASAQGDLIAAFIVPALIMQGQ